MRIMSFGFRVSGYPARLAWIERIMTPRSRSRIGQQAPSRTYFRRKPSGLLAGARGADNRMWFRRTEGRE
jgi:hypothetical protein